MSDSEEDSTIEWLQKRVELHIAVARARLKKARLDDKNRRLEEFKSDDPLMFNRYRRTFANTKLHAILRSDEDFIQDIDQDPVSMDSYLQSLTLTPSEQENMKDYLHSKLPPSERQADLNEREQHLRNLEEMWEWLEHQKTNDGCDDY